MLGEVLKEAASQERVRGYQVSRTDYDEFLAHFKTPLGVKDVMVRGESDWTISIIVGGTTVVGLARPEAVAVFRALSRKLIGQEYLAGLDPACIKE